MILAHLLLGFIGAIAPGDSHIAYVGRFDWSDKDAPACEWSATEVRLRVRGERLIATIESEMETRFEIVVDGQAKGVLALKKGKGQYTVELPAKGDHEVSLVRREEAFMGVTKFEGFDLPGGTLLQAHPRTRNIEVIGDSITCAYGNEGKDRNEHFKPETENAYESYASIAARKVNADVSIAAWSGRKMWPNDTIPEIYDFILPTKMTVRYDFRGPVPAAIVINLATNDFGKGAPDEAQWTAAYESFIKRLWDHYPKARIYATTGPMMAGQSLTTLKQYLQKIDSDLADRRLHLLDFETQREEDGYGADWHPSVKTDEIMGARLAEVLKRDLGW